MTQRTGASSKNRIDASILQQLNEGLIESATLMEALAVDFATLMAQIYPDMEAAAFLQLKQSQSAGITKRMEIAAEMLSSCTDSSQLDRLWHHPSDTVRGWMAYVTGRDNTLTLLQKLERIKPLANDPHFGVREWAWLALRPDISLDIESALELLEPWTADASENIRRFAIEATRPRGVWAKHIARLKTNPALGAPLLDAVMQDTSRYVQNSCANWLNDVGKSHAEWVLHYCSSWRERDNSAAVTYITRRALRNIE